MSVPAKFAQLQEYPFAKLAALTADCEPPARLHHIPLSLGEPKHAPPAFVIDYFSDAERLAGHLATYPATKGSEALRQAIADWLKSRFGATVSADTQVLPVTGTREALFSFAQALLGQTDNELVLMPNPFYQIYEGAALLGGAQPVFINNDPAQNYQQDFDAIEPAVWERTRIIYVCSPGNPTGQIIPEAQLVKLIELAHQYDFIIAADECYSELYFDEDNPPGSLLEASEKIGNPEHSRCVVFHSLSKRSNLPGLRSGFVAGDPSILATYLKYRTYHGCAMSAHHQAVSALAWSDESHVIENRRLYQEKFSAVTDILAPYYPIKQPDGGFYHWLQTPQDDLTFCKGLLKQQNVTVMPGRFLGREQTGTNQFGTNPGEGHVRVAWVAARTDCETAAQRLVEYAQSL